MIRIAKFITRHLFLTAFIALILIAVLLTAARLLVPVVLGSYADEVEQLAARVLGQPVIIGELDARWHGLGPEVVLRDVTLLSADASQPVMSLNEISVDFGLTDMIETGFLAPGRLSVVGTRLIIIRHPDGRLTMQGIEAIRGGSGPARGDASALVLIPPRVSITNARIEFIDHMGDRPPLLLDNVSLKIRNDGGRHQMDLELDIEGRPVVINADIRAKERRLEDWAGDIFVRLSQAPLKGLPRTLLPPGYALTEGVSDIELWSHWRQGQPQWIQSRVFATGISVWRDAGIGWHADELSTHALWQQTGNGWQLDLYHTTLAHQDSRHNIGKLSFAHNLSGTTAESYQLLADDLDIEVIASALSLGLPASQSRRLVAVAPSGRLQQLDLFLRPHAGPAFSITANVEGFSMRDLDRLPAIGNLSAQIKATSNGGQVLLKTHDASIHFASLFREPIPLASAEGRVAWQRLADGWRVQTRDLALRNDHISTLTRLSLDLSPGASPLIDLHTDFSNGDGSRMPLYLPAAIMPPQLVAWLDRAIPHATIPGGSAELSGHLDKFPFREPDSGHFEVLFGVEDATLDYFDGWPAIEGLSADVHFLNNQLEIRGGEGHLYQTRLQDLGARIEQLHPVSRIDIKGTALGGLEDGQRFLRESPLAEKLAFLAAEDTRVSGDSRLELSLSIPLKHDDGETVIEGRLSPTDGGLSLPRIGLDVESIEGELTFTHQGVSTKRLTGLIDEAPVKVAIATTREGIRIQGEGDFDTQSVKKRYPVLEPVPFHGKSSWRLLIDLPSAKGRKAPPARLEAKSHLTGTRVDLPFGLGKTAEEELPFTAAFALDDDPADGLTLRLGEFNAEVRHQAGDWEVGLDGPIAKGSLQIPGKGSKGPIRADMERLSVNIDTDAFGQQTEKKKRDAAKPEKLPEVELSAREVLLNGHSYGILNARTRHIDEGIRLEQMTLASETGELHASGEWTASDGQHRTELKADLQTRDFGRTLSDLRLSEGLSGSEGNLGLLLNWQGSPMDMALETMNGELHFSAEDGSFDDADVGLGRVLGLTNITALTRRLRLDFSDLFGQGFPFDSFNIDFDIEQGTARTDNGAIKGPIADIRIEGTTDMSTRQMDQKITVTPALSGTAALAGVLAGGPAVGLAMLVAGKGLERFAVVTYRMTGPWDAPQIERTGAFAVDEKSAEPAEQPPPSVLLPIH